MKKLLILFTVLCSQLFCFAQKPRLVLPEGHTGGVTSFSYSPDSRYLVTASNSFEDRTVRMWEIKSGKLLYTLKGHFIPVSNALFSPNGNYVLTHAYFNHIWNATTGELISMADSVISTATCFSADSRYLIMASAKKDEIIFWNIETEKSERIISNSGCLYSQLEVTKDGRHLIGYSGESMDGAKNGKITVWSMLDGDIVFTKECASSELVAIKTSPLSKKAFIATYNERFLIDLEKHTVIDTNYNSFRPDIRKCVFSNDDRFLYLAEDEALFQLSTDDFQYKYRLGRHEDDIAAIAIVPGKNELISLDNRGNLSIFNIGDTLQNSAAYETKYGRTNNLRFAPDGKTFTISTYNQYTMIIDYPAFSLSSYLTGEAVSMQEIQASKKADILTIGSFDYHMRIADGKTGRLIRTTFDSTQTISSIVLSPGGKKIIGVNTNNKLLSSWDVESGKKLFTIKDTGLLLYEYAYHPDEKTFVLWEGYNRILSIRDGTSGALKFQHRLNRAALYSNKVKYSPSGKYLLIGNNTNIEVRDANTGNLLRLLQGPEGVRQEILAMDINKEERLICAATDSLLLVWDFISGKNNIQRCWTNDPQKAKDEKFINIHFNPGGDKVILPLENGQAIIMNCISDSLELTLNNHYPFTLKDAVFSPTEKYIVTIGKKIGYMASHDAATGKSLARFGDQSEDILGYAFSANGNEIMTISENALHRYNLETGKRLYRTLFISNDDWLTIDDAGRFDGTEAARKLLYFTCGKEIVELEQVKDKLWVPNLADRINRGDSITATTINDLNICGLTPLVQQKNEDENTYQFQVIARKGGLGDVILQINGIEVKRYRPAELTRTDSTYELVINKKELEPYFANSHTNKVALRALTRNNDITSRSLIVDEDSVKVSSAPPRLFAVIVGVSDYKGDDLDLKYAAKDAVDFSAAINTAASKLLNTDTSNRVFIYNYNSTEIVRQQPEKNNIRMAFDDIGKKAGANDILLVFFAGHGVMEGERKQFYFLTAEASRISATEDVAGVGISTSELAEWMKPEKIKAQKRVLIFDACNSGQAIKDFVRLGNSEQGYLAARNDDKEQIIKAIDKLNEKSGLFILSASASNQSAYEMGRYTQGLLTHALLKVMKEQEDVLENSKFLNLSRWLNASEKLVTELSRENGARQEPQIVSNTNFNIGIVDTEVRNKIILPKEKPLFTFSNFQNGNESISDDDLEFSKLLNQRLSDISSRNTGGALLYSFTTTDANAYSLTGRYLVRAGLISVKVNIKKGSKIIHQFNISRPLSSLPELAEAIIQKATDKIHQ